MHQFVRKVTFFFISLIFLFYLKPVYLLINNNYKSIVAGSEIYTSIKKSKEKSDKKILLIGDSVGNQLFSNTSENDSINSLACNQAIGVIGQYFLIHNYLKTDNKPKEVYMVYTPGSFKNNLNQVYTYHYFLKPFFKTEYKNLFSNNAIKQIDKIPYSNFCNEPYILTSNWAPKLAFQDSIDYSFLSPISTEYLDKIKKLCTTNNIDFYIIPTPMKESNRAVVHNFNEKEFMGLSVESELSYYLNNINYLPDSLFIDDVHIKRPEIVKNDVLNEMKKARIHKNRYK